MDLARIPSRADESAASGTLLKRAAVHLVDLPALFRKATAPLESVTDWGGVWGGRIQAFNAVLAASSGIMMLKHSDNV